MSAATRFLPILEAVRRAGYPPGMEQSWGWANLGAICDELRKAGDTRSLYETTQALREAVEFGWVEVAPIGPFGYDMFRAKL